MKKKILAYAGRTGLIILTLLAAVVIFAYFGMMVLAKGPSPTASDLFVRSVMETSAAKFLARMYFTDDEIAEILASAGGGDDITDPSLIKIPEKSTDDDYSDIVPHDTDEEKDDPAVTPDETDAPETDVKKDDPDGGVEVFRVSGGTYNGTMLVIKDPSRVKVGTLHAYGDGYKGKSLRDFIKDSGAVGGINAGGFEDEHGEGSGAVPDGIVIRDGEIIWGDSETLYTCVIGFDKNHVLHVGNMTGAQALGEGIVDGISFAGGPILICNGVPENSKHRMGGGLNPRTAIGQRADGAVLMLVINGRQADSLGATHNDLIAEMVKFGAVNAANLDGGSSTLMMYNGELMNQSAYFFGERLLPDTFLIMGESK